MTVDRKLEHLASIDEESHQRWLGEGGTTAPSEAMLDEESRKWVKDHGYSTGVEETRIPANAQEKRVVDPTTGGEKGSKLARFSLIPPDFLWALAEHYGRGARKYEDRNWEKGYKWSLSLDALDRHLTQWLMGEDLDADTGSHHLVAVAWHAIALWWWSKHGKGTDDIRQRGEWISFHEPTVTYGVSVQEEELRARYKEGN